MIKKIPETAKDRFIKEATMYVCMYNDLKEYNTVKNTRKTIDGILSIINLMLGFAQIKQPRTK
jgi:hypothetical protein